MATAKFTTDGILDAAAQEVRAGGREVRIGDIARRLGAPTGSIYHRFGSREELLVRLWLRSVRRFHVEYLAAADRVDPEQAVLGMAECVVTFTRDHQDDAVAMTLYRQSRLLETAPEALRDEVAKVNDAIHARMAELAVMRYPQPEARHHSLIRIAAAECPYGLVRPYLWGTLPPWLPEVATASATAILALGD
ncbi:TetR/AcrR family transcriptional regulator [Enemella sp. A6]|uniref:TetR/AcrR family transcriptional regulator n=1 Tax=Enemella sp. A6 TaxID=3440152 RepID=UPI003EB79901